MIAHLPALQVIIPLISAPLCALLPAGRVVWLAAMAASWLAFLIAAGDGTAAAKRDAKAANTPQAGIKVEEHFLSNGMKLLLIPRHLSPTVSGGWVAHVGSVNERPGITGISHLFEHMMFKRFEERRTRIARLDDLERGRPVQ